MLIKGNNAVLDLEGVSGFAVHPDGWLTLERLEIRYGGGSDVIANDGRTDLQGVSLLNNSPGRGLGRYLRISLYGPGKVLLMWNSFDELGQPVWVYGFGGSGQQTVTVDAFVNKGVALVDGNIIGEAEPIAWGTLSVTVWDCQTINFDYNPHDPSIVAQTQPL